jgi:hypothetical protein
LPVGFDAGQTVELQLEVLAGGVGFELDIVLLSLVLDSNFKTC